MSNNNNTLRPSLDDLPTEIVAEIGRFAGIEGLPALRSTGRLSKNATILHFANLCFRSFNLSITSASLYKLHQAASHPVFGPQIRHITFNISGTEAITPSILASSWAVLNAFAARDQKIAIKVCVSAIGITDTATIETNIYRFLLHLVRGSALKSCVKSPVVLDLPSPPKDPRDAPSRSVLFNSLAILAVKDDLLLNYADHHESAAVMYNKAQKSLTISNLAVKHITELKYLFAGLHINKLVVKDSDIDTTSLERLCAIHRPTLHDIKFNNLSLWESWSFGDSVPTPWKHGLEILTRLPGLRFCKLTGLRMENLIPSWDVTRDQKKPVQVTNFSVSGIVTVNHRLEHLITTTRW